MPNISSPAKIERIRDYGADLVVGGDGYAEALAAAKPGARSPARCPFMPSISGKHCLVGTLGLELESQVADLDTLLVEVGGGGLIGGIAAWYQRRISVVGVEPEASPTLTRALAAGKPVDAETGGIAAELARATPGR